MSDSDTITLPKREQLLRRLMDVDGSTERQQRLYPLILESAGAQLNGVGVVNVLKDAIEQYASGMHPSIRRVLAMELESYIIALVLSRTVREDALRYARSL